MDCASGAGYGSWLLRRAGATSVVGVDVAPDAKAWADKHFAIDGVEFRLSVDGKLPLESGAVDQVISLETIEHVPDTAIFVAELARVLVPGGGLVISTPLTFGEARLHPDNPFHRREFDDTEFAEMISPHFEILQRLGQHSLQSARFASLQRAPGLSALMQAGVHRLLPRGVRALGRKLLARGAAQHKPWISEERWREAAVQLIVAKKKS
jgi:SAM-dependent methyltransferase